MQLNSYNIPEKDRNSSSVAILEAIYEFTVLLLQTDVLAQHNNPLIRKGNLGIREQIIRLVEDLTKRSS